LRYRLTEGTKELKGFMASVDKDSVLVKRLKDNFASSIIETTIFRGEVAHLIKKEALLDICRFLKSEKELKMDYLSDVLGVDYHPQTPRFEVVYQFYSTTNRLRLRLKLRLEDGETVPTVTGLWRSANFAERETYDMFGIVFDGHPDLKRVYMPRDWEGFPLRKDYPLRGYRDEYNPYGKEKK
jgi:NADH-quinone oxidoreductase subunit C